MLTIRQTKASALRDLRNLMVGWWPMPILLFAGGVAFSPEVTSSFRNHGQQTSSGEWFNPFFIFLSIIFSLTFGRLLLRSLCGLFGRAAFVFDKSQNMFLCNGQPVGPLGEICRIKSQLNKGYELNPMFRLMVEIPEGWKIAIATTHFIPAPGEYRVIRTDTGPTSRFPYMHCWEDYDRQAMVPFLDPEIAEIERRITQFLER